MREVIIFLALLSACAGRVLESGNDVLLPNREVEGLECYEYIRTVEKRKGALFRGDKQAIDDVKAELCNKFPRQCSDFNGILPVVMFALTSGFDMDQVCAMLFPMQGAIVLEERQLQRIRDELNRLYPDDSVACKACQFLMKAVEWGVMHLNETEVQFAAIVKNLCYLIAPLQVQKNICTVIVNDATEIYEWILHKVPDHKICAKMHICPAKNKNELKNKKKKGENQTKEKIDVLVEKEDRKCLQELADSKSLGIMLGGFTPRCNAEGDYEAMQCGEGYCHCVDAQTGEKIEGSQGQDRGPVDCDVDSDDDDDEEEETPGPPGTLKEDEKDEEDGKDGDDDDKESEDTDIDDKLVPLFRHSMLNLFRGSPMLPSSFMRQKLFGGGDHKLFGGWPFTTGRRNPFSGFGRGFGGSGRFGGFGRGFGRGFSGFGRGFGGFGLGRGSSGFGLTKRVKPEATTNPLTCELCKVVIGIVKKEVKMVNESINVITAVIKLVCENLLTEQAKQECLKIDGEIKQVVALIEQGVSLDKVCVDLEFCPNKTTSPSWRAVARARSAITPRRCGPMCKIVTDLKEFAVGRMHSLAQEVNGKLANLCHNLENVANKEKYTKVCSDLMLLGNSTEVNLLEMRMQMDDSPEDYCPCSGDFLSGFLRKKINLCKKCNQLEKLISNDIEKVSRNTQLISIAFTTAGKSNFCDEIPEEHATECASVTAAIASLSTLVAKSSQPTGICDAIKICRPDGGGRKRPGMFGGSRRPFFPLTRATQSQGRNESDCEFCENCEKKIFGGWLGGVGGGFGGTRDVFNGLLNTMKNGISIECRSHSNGTDVSTVCKKMKDGVETITKSKELFTKSSFCKVLNIC